MDRICLRDIRYGELVSQLAYITGVNENVIKQSIDLLKLMLPADMESPEYFIEKEETVSGVMGFFIPETTFYLSIKRGTFHLLLLILNKWLYGIPSIVDAFAGISKKGIWKIKDNQYCIVAEILEKKETTIWEMKQFYDNRKECCNRSEIWKCPFLLEEDCLLEAEKVEELIGQLIDDDLIVEKGDVIGIIK